MTARHTTARAASTARGGRILAVVAVLSVGCISCTTDATSTSTTENVDAAITGVPGLPDAALEVISQPQFAAGRWAISVEDLDTGQTLIDLDGDKMAEPGSFVKTYSAGAAWLKWGPEYTFITPVKQSGSVTDGTLTGQLILVGQGDLTMGGRTKADGTVDFTNLDHNDANPLPGATLTPQNPLTGLDELARQVRAAGINAVNGDVVIDDRLFSGELDGKPITPIVINQNVLDILITPGSVGEPATAELTPAVAPWTLDIRVQTVAAGEDAEIDDPRVDPADPDTIIVEGTAAAGSSPVLKVYEFDDPATFARTALIEALGRAGVTVSADPVAANPADVLPDVAAVEALPAVAELKSLPLSQEVTYVMKISYNRGAQTFICRLAVVAGSSRCNDGMAVAQQIWADAMGKVR